MKLFDNINRSRIRKLIPLLDQAVVSGGNFILCILLTRIMGLEGFGQFTLAWLIVLFCSSLQQAWMINPMYNFAPRMTIDETKEYLSDLFILQIAFALIAGCLTYLISYYSHILYPQLDSSIQPLWMALTVFAYLMYDFLRKLSYVKSRGDMALLIDVVVYSIQLMTLIYMLNNASLSLSSVFILLALSFMIPLPFLFTQIEVKVNISTIGTTLKLHWNYSYWLLGTALLQWISGNYFIIVAATILSPVAVGAIRILQNIIGVLHVLFQAVENFVPISASRIFHENGMLAMRKYLQQMTIKGALGTVVLSLSIAIFGKQIITLLYGHEYVDYAYLLYAFSLLYLIIFIGMNLRFAIRTLELNRSIFIAYVSCAAFTLLTANYLVGYFGLEGIMIGLLVTQLIMLTVFIISLKNKTKMLWKSST